MMQTEKAYRSRTIDSGRRGIDKNKSFSGTSKYLTPLIPTETAFYALNLRLKSYTKEENYKTKHSKDQDENRHKLPECFKQPKPSFTYQPLHRRKLRGANLPKPKPINTNDFISYMEPKMGIVRNRPISDRPLLYEQMIKQYLDEKKEEQNAEHQKRLKEAYDQRAGSPFKRGLGNMTMDRSTVDTSMRATLEPRENDKNSKGPTHINSPPEAQRNGRANIKPNSCFIDLLPPRDVPFSSKSPPQPEGNRLDLSPTSKKKFKRNRDNLFEQLRNEVSDLQNEMTAHNIELKQDKFIHQMGSGRVNMNNMNNMGHTHTGNKYKTERQPDREERANLQTLNVIRKGNLSTDHRITEKRSYKIYKEMCEMEAEEIINRTAIANTSADSVYELKGKQRGRGGKAMDPRTYATIRHILSDTGTRIRLPKGSKRGEGGGAGVGVRGINEEELLDLLKEKVGEITARIQLKYDNMAADYNQHGMESIHQKVAQVDSMRNIEITRLKTKTIPNLVKKYKEILQKRNEEAQSMKDTLGEEVLTTTEGEEKGNVEKGRGQKKESIYFHKLSKLITKPPLDSETSAWEIQDICKTNQEKMFVDEITGLSVSHMLLQPHA